MIVKRSPSARSGFRIVVSFFLAVIACISVPQLSVANVPAYMPADPPQSKTGSISGFVEDSVSKEPMVAARVAIKGTKLGAITNKSGYFIVQNVPVGAQTLVASNASYNPREQVVSVIADDDVQVRINLSENLKNATQITVSADAVEDKRQINISSVNIPMEQVKMMRIGGEADIFRALQMLPGVLTSSQISSGLYIRGGSPDQNLVLLDGMTVYNPTHLFGFISAFNSDAVKDVDLIKGGFPAEYGGRMSAVLNVTQKDGNRDHVEGLVGVGLISSRASIQGPIGNGSFFVGGRRTYLDLVLGLVPEDPESPFPTFNFYDINAKLTQNFGENDKISLSGFLTSDALTLEQPGLVFNIGIGNKATSGRWQHIFAPSLFSIVTFSASHYRNGFDGNNAGLEFTISNGITDYSLKSELEWYVTDAITLKSGYEGTLYNFTYEQITNRSQNQSGSGNTGALYLDVWDNIHALFGQLNWQITDLLSFQTGIRGSYWTTSKNYLADPRIAIRYQLYDEVAIKAAWGMYHQYLRLASAPDFSFFDTWLPTDNTVPAGRSDHFILAVETKPWDGISFNVDMYYKNLYNINELRQNQTRASSVGQVFYIGNGHAYGIEFFLQRKIGDFTGWIGYALGFVNAQFDSVNRGAEFRPKYDRRHDLKLTGLYKLNKRWEFGATFVFQSGQSYTGATSQFGASMPDWQGGIIMVNPSQRWGLRLPNSHQLNLSANYNTTLFDLPFTILLDVYNVYSRRDIWFRFYDTSKQIPEVTDVRLLPIIPTLSFEFKF